MKQRLIFATGNEGKMREIREILADTGYEILSMKEAGIDLDIVEDGKTFEENAIIKAKAVMEASGELTLADDSGLEIDAFGGEPGIYSSRYLGEDTSYTEKNQIILERMKDIPEEKRSAKFVCVIAAAFPDGQTYTTRGTMEGIIGYESKGGNGFGYDPIFYLPEFKKYSAQLSSDEKNHLSHRGEALRKMKEVL
ncbi:non-canonical purine NTP pyrophosphatase, RdgB/HAM1 family [Anaerostipes sp. 494a]|uniref:XTP/dITP diphosphatase n=1 Tax=Anaerostipes TaxID=207244 RepID=UPI000952C3E4|nr:MULTISPECIES: XTP/dITP diphosphatase [Anaerostipes]OLR59086.1 non-canonical purine NTP pyrophosphatase, RdgB/HAM1 family [Anaerostipes sp. 494a]